MSELERPPDTSHSQAPPAHLTLRKSRFVVLVDGERIRCFFYPPTSLHQYFLKPEIKGHPLYFSWSTQNQETDPPALEDGLPEAQVWTVLWTEEQEGWGSWLRSLPSHGTVQILRTECPGVTETPDSRRTQITSSSGLLAILQFPGGLKEEMDFNSNNGNVNRMGECIEIGSPRAADGVPCPASPPTGYS